MYFILVLYFVVASPPGPDLEVVAQRILLPASSVYICQEFGQKQAAKLKAAEPRAQVRYTCVEMKDMT